MALIKHFEFWPARVFETPYYLYLLWRCLRHGLPPKHLAKANYALDHGELGLGSKFTSQMSFDQTHFLPTLFIESNNIDQTSVDDFVEAHGFPLILKPDNGAVGKGIVKLDSTEALAHALAGLQHNHLLQKFTTANYEYGVFYVRQRGKGKITGINRKHFPTVTGDGTSTIAELAAAHPRHTDHWPLFLRYLDTQHIPSAGEDVQLSFIGSHTMGCKFTDDTHLANQAMLRTLEQTFASQPGFNFGRLDVKAHSEAAFLAGDFVIIEVNGIASLPTHMFDPTNKLSQAYRIFLKHGKLLSQVAAEHRLQPMELMSYRDIIRKAGNTFAELDEVHAAAKGDQPAAR